MVNAILLCLAVLSIGGCATQPATELPADHPAYPDAASAPPLVLSDVLRPTTTPATAPAKPTQGGDHHAH